MGGSVPFRGLPIKFNDEEEGLEYTHITLLSLLHPAALYGLTSVLTDYDVPRRRAAKQATTALRSCSTLCMSEAICILRMRQGHPAHGHVH